MTILPLKTSLQGTRELLHGFFHSSSGSSILKKAFPTQHVNTKKSENKLSISLGNKTTAPIYTLLIAQNAVNIKFTNDI